MKKINILMGIFLMLNMLMLTKAQSPGGIAPQLWYRGDAGITQSAGTVTQWNNSASASYNLVQQGGAGTAPAYNTSQINFNPSVRFDGTNDRLFTASVPQNVTTTAAAPFQTSQYVVYRKLGAATNPLYSHSDGGGGTWNVGASTAGGMLITNRFVNTSSPAANEVRLQSLNGDSNAATAYLNGTSMSSSFTGGTASAGTQSFWVGAQGTSGFSNSDIAEIVIYNAAQSGRQQIESYLSLKYGITKSGNYVASNGTTNYWNAVTNTGYNNNIAGIGRDDNSVLYQKQSMSINSGQQILIGLTGMADTNTANSGTLTDQQFLLVGDNGLEKAPSVLISGIPGVNSRFASVWKVQNTGTVGTVRIMWPQGLNNLKLVQNSSDPTFASGNTVTDMSANTQTINGVVYNYADVSLANGQFFTLASFVNAPGGIVSGLRFWLKSDSGVTTSGTSVTSWDNQSVVGLSVTQATAAKQPVFVNNYMNFNPGINFASNQEMALLNGNPTVFGTTNPVTAFYLGNSTSVTGSRTVMEMHTAAGDNPTFEWRGTLFGMDLDGTAFQDNGYHASKTVAANIPYIISSGFNNQNAGGQIFNMFNGAFQNIRNGNSTVSNIGTNIYVGGASGGEYFQGNLPEIIGYNTYVNNATDIQKINSYLAVKYGMTLDQTTALDYLNSAGTVIWNGTANAAFNNNIAGIERDDASALNQKQSMSVNSGSQVVIGIAGALANTNALNTNSFSSDLNSVMWGDNGLAKAPAVPISGIVGSNYRFASVWKVQNTGSVGTVRVMWPQGLTNLKLVQNSTDPTFTAGNIVTDMSSNTQTINGTVYNYADVSLADGQYFTFAAQVYAPGGVLAALWYRADRNLTPATGSVTSWKDYSYSGINITPALSVATSAPSAVTGIGSNLNFNPGVSFTQANAIGNGSNLNAITGLNYTIYTSTTQIVNTSTRIFSLNAAGLSGAAKYDVPGLQPTSVFLRNASGTQILSATFNPPYTLSPSVTRTTFTSTSASRAQDGSAIGTTGTFSGASVPNGGVMIGRNANDGGDDTGFDGTLSETIVFDGTLSANQINRIDSYLAIKGGITLNTVNTPNYLNSASLTIWTGATNTGYQNNITGIGRDDLSDLNQKQSQSINTGSQVLIGIGGALANTNALNGNSFTANQQFVMWGDNGLVRVPALAISGIPGANFRFASVWKVQNTGSVGTVRVMWPIGRNNLKLVQNSSDPTFTTGNIITDMSANTQTINGIVYNYADVTLADGQYFTFAAQVYAPGGIASGLEAWHKADSYAYTDNGTTLATSGQAIQRWNDSNGSGTDFVQATAGNKPTYTPNSILNFNPTVRFTRSANNFMSYKYTASSVKTQGSLYFAVKQAALGIGSGFLGFDDTLDYPGWHTLTDNHYLIFNANFIPQLTNLIDINIPNLVGSSWKNGAGSTTSNVLFDTRYNGFSQSFGTVPNVSVSTDTYRVGSDTNFGAYDGNVGEVIYYSRDLSPLEKNQVDSYLAIKYGTTLRSTNFTTGTFDYLNSSGNVIWNGTTTNSSYHNNVTGIGRDDAAALNQKQSMSTNLGAQVLIGIGGALANTNALNTNSFPTDKQYLVWGDNGLAKAPAVTISGIVGATYRFASVWKAQNTGSIGTVRVMWPQGLTNLKLVQNPTDPTFTAGNIVTDMSINTQSINGVVYNYADVALANNQFFTFAAYVLAPGGVASNLRVWIKADDNPNGNTTDNVAIATWPNKGLIGGNFVGGAASPNTIALQTTGPLYRNSSAMNINFNPVAQSTSTSGLGIQNAFAGTGDDYTMIALNKNPTVSGFRNMFHFHGGANLNATSGPNEWFGAFINSPIAWPSATGTASYTANIPAVTTFSATGTGTIAYQVNSISKGSGASLSKSGTDLVIGVDGDGGPDDGIDIIMPENIMYNSVLSSTDYNKVVSYLAIKYGVTLGTFAAPVNYTSTNSTTVWSTASSSYQTNVIGIARDDIEGLHQRISKSQDAVADIITISTNNDFTTANSSANHTDIANDQFYFITGNNGAATTYNAQNIMNRRWKVQSTGTAQNLFIKTSDIQATYLVYADDAAITTNVVNIPLTSGATPGIQIPNGKFFTFAKFSFCTKDPNTSPADTITKIGITIQTKQSGWPENLPNGAVALESKTRGFVITRTQSSLIANPVEGMLMYDTVDKCMKLYNGTSWNCVVRSCNQ